MIIRAGGALSGASLLPTVNRNQQTRLWFGCGAAWVSRTQSEISCRRGMFLCFGLDPSTHSLRRVKAQALRGNKTFPSGRRLFESKQGLLPNNLRLEASRNCSQSHESRVLFALFETCIAAHSCMSAGVCALLCSGNLQTKPLCRWSPWTTSRTQPTSVFFLLPALGTACCAGRMLCMRNRKHLAAKLILRFSCRMSGAIRTGSKLSASLTRPHRRRLIASCDGQLGKGVKPPLHPPCRFGRQTETVPVSAPFGFFSSSVASSSLREVRP